MLGRERARGQEGPKKTERDAGWFRTLSRPDSIPAFEETADKMR
jgi:hypothetical protein